MEKRTKRLRGVPHHEHLKAAAKKYKVYDESVATKWLLSKVLNSKKTLTPELNAVDMPDGIIFPTSDRKKVGSHVHFDLIGSRKFNLTSVLNACSEAADNEKKARRAERAKEGAKSAGVFFKS